MTGVEIALLIVLSVAVIALIVTLIVVLKRLDALSREATEFLTVTRVELANTLQEIRTTSKNISDTSQSVTGLTDVIGSTLKHVDRALGALEGIEIADLVANVAGKAAKGAGVGIASAYAGIREACNSLRQAKHETPEE